MADESEHSLFSKTLQLEDELKQECKELIRTMPMEKGWIATQLHKYEEFWVGTNHLLERVLFSQKHFEAHDTDIFVVTLPKSGTTWLKAWTFALINRKRYPDIHNHDHPLLTTNPHELVPFLDIRLYSQKWANGNSVPDLTSLSSPRLFGTHIPYFSLPKSVKESSCKVVYACRDPKDNFVSLWHFSNMLRPEAIEYFPLEERFEKYCRGVSPYGPFWEHSLGYWKESLERPQKVMFLRYEEMKMQPAFTLKKLAEFLGCPFSKEEESTGVISDILDLCSFNKLSNLEVNKTGKLLNGMENKFFFRRGQVGDSKNLLTKEMIEQLNTITQERLVKHGLSF